MFQLPNTASMASLSCTMGSCGKATTPSTSRLGYSTPETFSEDLLELGNAALQVLCGQVGVGGLALRLFFMTLMAFSNRSPSGPMTTLETSG